MKLHLSNSEGINLFTHVEPSAFGINGYRYNGNVAVLPNEVLPGWTTATLATLRREDFVFIAARNIDIILLGTGPRLAFPPRELMRPLYETGRGVEVMDTPAACRTFNILVTEGRKVGAFLLVA